MACCSAIPTSKVRLGNLLPNLSIPVPPGMAAVMAHTVLMIISIVIISVVVIVISHDDQQSHHHFHHFISFLKDVVKVCFQLQSETKET